MFYINEDFFTQYLDQYEDALCICGSGKKFGDCHKPKFTEEKAHPAELYFKSIKNTNKACFCLFQNDECSNDIIKAHSISKKFLVQIAENNHVLTFLKSIDLSIMNNLHNDSILPNPNKIGINEASVFTGFCGYHDNVLFESFERYKFEYTIDQISAIHLRAIAKEIYVKKDMIALLLNIQKDIGKVSTRKGTFNKSIGLAQSVYANNLGIKDLWREFQEITDYINNKSDNFKYIVIEILGECNILNSSIVNPSYSADGKLLQNYDDRDLYVRSFGFNVIPESDRYYYVFTWFDNSAINKFMKVFFEKYQENILNALIQLSFAFSENSAIRISWYDSLTKLSRQRLLKLFWNEVIHNNYITNIFEQFRFHKYTAGKINSFKTNTEIKLTTGLT